MAQPRRFWTFSEKFSNIHTFHSVNAENREVINFEKWGDNKLNTTDSTYIKFLRHMVKGGRQRTAAITYMRKNGTEGTYSKPVMTKEHILKIALEAFAEFGFEGVSVSTIAKRAGVHDSLLHYHFGSKKDIWKKSITQVAIKYDEGCMALLLIGTDETQAENVAKRIHTAVNQLVMGDQKLNEKFTLSVGVAEMAEEDYADLLIARTQAALDRAVTEGGDQTSH